MICWAIIPVKPLAPEVAAARAGRRAAALNKHLFGCVLNATRPLQPDRVDRDRRPLLLP
jgi:hypothetical protein